MRQHNPTTSFLLSRSISRTVENLHGLDRVAMMTMQFVYEQLGDLLYKVYIPQTGSTLYHELDANWCYAEFRLAV